MDSERPHRTGTTTSTSSELFICFTSRLSSSSSSMKFSKSILSPGRSRDPPISLSTSLSRRLRTNGSIKGGQASPMFPTGAKKRGSGFENPEPSSPKVTCIGQVRVKTKKQGKKMRTHSRRQSGEVSFRKLEQPREGLSQFQSQNQNQNHTPNYPQANLSNQYHHHQQQQECLPHRNQRWVHLPLTICEALRAFGAEFSCLFPCRSSCFSTSEREKEEKLAVGSSEESGQSSCGAVFARWLVALQDGEGGKGGEIELVVGGDEERTGVTERPLRRSRRHVFDEIEIRDEKCGVKDEVVEEEEARVSICIPPKNALLLMRCRSDPVKMADLANRFWESPVCKDEKNEDEDERDKDESEVKDNHQMEQKEGENWVSVVEVDEEEEHLEAGANLEMEVKENEEQEVEEETQEESLHINEELQDEKQEEEETEVNQTIVEENKLNGTSSFDASVDQKREANVEDDPIQEKEGESRARYHSSSVYSDDKDVESEEEELADESALELEAQESTVEKETEERAFEDELERVTSDSEGSEGEEETQEGESKESEEREAESQAEVERESGSVKKEEKESSVLPECLLLMMCEPKLSMEVSRETWVCSTDFIRWQPQKDVKVKPKDGGDESKKRVSTDSNSYSNPVLHQPPRSSCSFPATAAAAVAGVSMATMIEQKLVNAVGCEPFVLTRCKSEPMSTASKLAPEACFWNNRKLEPHRRATFGIGAAGVGF